MCVQKFYFMLTQRIRGSKWTGSIVNWHNYLLMTFTWLQNLLSVSGNGWTSNPQILKRHNQIHSNVVNGGCKQSPFFLSAVKFHKSPYRGGTHQGTDFPAGPQSPADQAPARQREFLPPCTPGTR